MVPGDCTCQTACGIDHLAISHTRVLITLLFRRHTVFSLPMGMEPTRSRGTLTNAPIGIAIKTFYSLHAQRVWGNLSMIFAGIMRSFLKLVVPQSFAGRLLLVGGEGMLSLGPFTLTLATLVRIWGARRSPARG